MFPEDNNDIETNNQNQPAQPAPLGKGQKVAVAVLAVFAIFAVVMWGRQFKKSINGPFAYNTSTETQNLSATQNNGDEDLKNKDTDLDGLSDWDELNLYLTSPYLEDSDSDGFSDKNEIDSGNDPNCPTGRDCYGTTNPLENNAAEENSPSQDGNITTGLNLELPTNSQTNTTENNGQLSDTLGATPDAASLRKMLLDAGMDEKILNQFSDADLLAEWQKTFSGSAQ